MYRWADNSYGYPTPQTLERPCKAYAKVFRNDEHGDVIVTIKDGNADVAVTEAAEISPYAGACSSGFPESSPRFHNHRSIVLLRHP